MNFTQQYGKNRQRCQQNIFYYAVWQLLLYFYREFPSKILSVWLPRRENIVDTSMCNLLKHTFCLTYNVLEILYSGVFGVADYEFELIQKSIIADLILR